MKSLRSILPNAVMLLAATSYGVTAYAAPNHVHHKQHKAAVMAKTTVTAPKNRAGFVDTIANGQGTYTTTKTGTASDRTVTTTDTFTDGVVIKSTDVITKNSNGSTTYDITTVNETTDKTSTNDKTVSSTGAITGTITQANGQVDQESGQIEKTSYGTDTSLVLTNSKDQTEDLNTENLKSSDASGSVTTGTGFNGKAIDNASLQTTNTAPNLNTVATTVDGSGTYSFNQAGNTITSARTFGDGASTSSNTITQNSNGSTSYERLNSYTSSTGAQSSSILDETYSSSGTAGVDNITGTFSQSNGHAGSLTGSDSKTNYGFANDVTYTDQNGLTRSAQTDTLDIGDAILNVNTATTFNGKSNDSVGLITGAASDYINLNHPEAL